MFAVWGICITQDSWQYPQIRYCGKRDSSQWAISILPQKRLCYLRFLFQLPMRSAQNHPSVHGSSSQYALRIRKDAQKSIANYGRRLHRLVMNLSFSHL
jgi:hypothetical protein